MQQHVLGYETYGDDLRYPVYIPSLLAKSPWYGKCTSLVISSLMFNIANSKRWVREYSSQNLTHRDLFLYLNHPITEIRLCGLVVGWKWKLIGSEDRAFWYLDDCSSTIMCQCTKSVLIACNLPLTNLSGWTFVVTGKLDHNRGEFKVSSIEVLKSLKEEVQFWTIALENVRKLKDPWFIDREILTGIFTESPKTPTRVDITNANFIERLRDQDFIENKLELASPYTEYNSSGIGVCNTDLLQSTLEQDLSTQNQSDNKVLGAHRDHSTKQLFKTPSKKLIQQKLIACLIEASMKSDPCYCTDVVSTICVEQELYEAQKFVEHLIESGIIQALEQDRVDLRNLQTCYRYISFRFQSLINVKIPHRTVKYEQIRSVCNLHNISNKLIIQLCKHFLNSTHIGDLIDWWLEPVCDDKFKVYFTYTTT